MTNIKRCVLILFLLAFVIKAQQPDKRYNDFSLLFGVNNSFNLKNLEGIALSGQVRTGDKWFIRLSAGLERTNILSDEMGMALTDTVWGKTENSLNKSLLVLEADYLYKSGYNNRSNFYLGFGPFISLDLGIMESSFFSDEEPVKKGYKTDLVHYGFTFIFGAEVKIKDFLFLFAEYKPSIGYRKTELEFNDKLPPGYEEEYGSNDFFKRTGWSTENRINLGLGINF